MCQTIINWSVLGLPLTDRGLAQFCGGSRLRVGNKATKQAWHPKWAATTLRQTQWWQTSGSIVQYIGCHAPIRWTELRMTKPLHIECNYKK